MTFAEEVTKRVYNHNTQITMKRFKDVFNGAAAVGVFLLLPFFETLSPIGLTLAAASLVALAVILEKVNADER